MYKEVLTTSLRLRIAYAANFRHPCHSRDEAEPGLQRPLGILQEFTKQEMKVVHAIFPFHRIAPAVIGG
jgi:hypothetical protein